MGIPEVSVIIPCHNIEKYLPDCLNSILRQTFPEFEAICIDDGSTDQTPALLDEFQRRDQRIRVIHQENQGVSAARNLGFRCARGKYLLFIDGDDWVEYDLLAKMVDTGEKTRCDMVVCGSQVHALSPTLRDRRSHRVLCRSLAPRDSIREIDRPAEDAWRMLKEPGSWPFVWNKLIRKSVIWENNVMFPEGLPLGEDSVFLIWLFQYTKKIVYCSDILHNYRYQRADSATQMLSRDRCVRFSHHIEVVTVLLEGFRERGILEENEDHLLHWILDFLYADYLALPAKDREGFQTGLADLFIRYGLGQNLNGWDAIDRRRLKRLTSEEANSSRAEQVWEIIQMKIENRWRWLSRWGVKLLPEKK